MASIERKANGSYAVRWREGRVSRQQTCGTRREAERVKRAVEEATALGRRWDPKATLSAPLLGDSADGAGDGAVSAYLRSLSRRGLKPGSINHIMRILAPWGDWMERRQRRRPDVGDFSRLMLEQYYDARCAETSQRRAVTCAKHVEALWKWLATRDEYAEHTPPVRPVDLPNPGIVLQPYALTWAQVDWIIQREREREHWARADWWWRALVVQRYTGLRISQAARLEWRDIDLEARLLTIRPELGKSRQESRGRIVPVCEHLAEEVAGWGVRSGHLVGEGVRLNSGHSRWRLMVERAGFTREQVPQPTHCIRRTFVAELLKAGVSDAVIKLFVGHDPGMTAGVYADHDMALRGQAQDALQHIPRIGSAGAVCALGARPTQRKKTTG